MNLDKEKLKKPITDMLEAFPALKTAWEDISIWEKVLLLEDFELDGAQPLKEGSYFYDLTQIIADRYAIEAINELWRKIAENER